MEIKGIKGFLDEGKSYVELGDSIQASEKLYKAAEEAIKALSRAKDIEQLVKLVESC